MQYFSNLIIGYVPVATEDNTQKRKTTRGTIEVDSFFFQINLEVVTGESNSTVGSWNNNDLILQCVARGVPTASFRWFKPGGGEIITNVNPFKGGSRVTVTTGAPRDYGQYKCRANNLLGLMDHIITVNQWREYQVQNKIVLRNM